MSFNAKVRESGCLFEALNEEGSNFDAVILEEGRSYSGFLYPGQFDSDKNSMGYVVFRSIGKRSPAVFLADKLEQVQIPLDIKTKENG